MSTNYKKLRHSGSFGNTHTTLSDYLAHKDKPIDGYIVLSVQGPTAADRPDTSNNLFDDSPIEDWRWAQMTRQFIRHTKHR